jgi:site-specific DNA-methyltransferase (adenine-specific)
MTEKLLQGDCLELMKDIPDESIDMILCDLPYAKTHNEWDSVINMSKLWEQYNRIIKENGAIVLFGQTDFSAKLIVSNLKMFRYTLVWDKVRTTGFLNAKRMPLRQHEDVLVFYKKLPTYNPQMTEGGEPSHSRGNKFKDAGSIQDKGKVYGNYDHANVGDTKRTTKYPTSILKFPNKVVGNLHPTQKPVALLEYLIKTYTNENEIVLDNTMGSGSTGVAAINTNRNFIGIELDEEYFNTAKNRIEQAKEATSTVA